MEDILSTLPHSMMANMYIVAENDILSLDQYTAKAGNVAIYLIPILGNISKSYFTMKCEFDDMAITNNATLLLK